jgi:hypothetical protein
LVPQLAAAENNAAAALSFDCLMAQVLLLDLAAYHEGFDCAAQLFGICAAADFFPAHAHV